MRQKDAGNAHKKSTPTGKNKTLNNSFHMTASNGGVIWKPLEEVMISDALRCHEFPHQADP